MPEFDPCAELARLKQRRTAIAAGESESRIRFGDEETEYHKADPAALDREIARLERECAIAEGRTPARRRYAARARY